MRAEDLLKSVMAAMSEVRTSNNRMTLPPAIEWPEVRELSTTDREAIDRAAAKRERKAKKLRGEV